MPNIHTKAPKPLKNPKLPDCCTNSLWPNCGDHLGYFANIEIDSHLKNINNKTNKCLNREYKNGISPKKCQNDCCNFLKEENKYNYPDKNVNRCVNFNFPNKCENKDDVNTLYDYSNHEICNMGCEKAWNIRTKRNS